MSNKTSLLSVIDEKLDEQKSEIAALKTSKAKSKSTQLHTKRREYRTLKLVRELLAANPDIKLSEDAHATLVAITTLKSERVVYEKIVVQEGDNVLELMQKYDRNDIVAKLRKAADKAGLQINPATGIVEVKA